MPADPWHDYFSALCHAAKLTSTTLSQAMSEAGLKRSPQVCGRWLNGHQTPGWRSMEALARVLGQTSTEAKLRFYEVRGMAPPKRSAKAEEAA